MTSPAQLTEEQEARRLAGLRILARIIARHYLRHPERYPEPSDAASASSTNHGRRPDADRRGPESDRENAR